MRSNPLGILILVLWALLMARVAWKLLGGRFGRTVTVKAEVVNKQTVEFYSKTAPGGKHIRYVVNFLVDGKKKSFYVSEFSYQGYREGEKGQLTYRGDRLIEFG